MIVSTAAFRLVAGLLLAGVVFASGGWPSPTPAYRRAAALVIPPEVAGMVFMSLALRAGDLSLVQPLMELIPFFVTLAEVLFLQEVPTAHAAGILLVAAGVYCIGLNSGGSALEPP